MSCAAWRWRRRWPQPVGALSFATGSETLGTVPALASSGYATEILPDAANDADVLAGRFEGGADVLVVDHYGRDASFERACRAWARHILAFDDATGRDHDCDLLLDAAADDPARYRDHVPAHARVLCGPAFATVRRSFLDRRSAALARRDGRPVGNILLSFGATDPSNATCRVIDALGDAVGDAVMTVVLSSRAPHIDEVRRRGNWANQPHDRRRRYGRTHDASRSWRSAPPARPLSSARRSVCRRSW